MPEQRFVGAAAAAIDQRWTMPLTVVVVLWVAALFEPQLLGAALGAEALPSVPALLYLALVLMVATSATDRSLYPAFLILVLNGIVMIPFAENSGVAFELVVKILLLFYLLAIGSIAFITSVEKTLLIHHLFFWQFLWWWVHSAFQGRVAWHSVLGNEDAFGPLMVMGVGYCFYFGLSTRSRRLRRVAFLVSGLCVAGVVSSFARGAFLACAFVGLFVWMRSPYKGRTAVALIVGAVIVFVTADMLFPNGLFWQEMSTASDGFETWTGFDRRVLWKTAWREFVECPLFGVGAGNFGVFAGAHLWSDPELTWLYRLPGRLWGRVPHSIYFQTLAEYGLIGVSAALALLIDFWRRNAQLRSAPFAAAWSAATRGQSDLRMLSLALQVAMVAYLVTGFFYDQLYVHWFYSILTMNVLLHRNVRRAAAQGSAAPAVMTSPRAVERRVWRPAAAARAVEGR